MNGRPYRVLASLTYLGGTLDGDNREALRAAVGANLGIPGPDLSFSVSTDPHNVVTVGVTLRAANPVDLLGRLNGAVDRSLIATGLFEEFDVTGKVIRIAPLELADRLGELPPPPAPPRPAARSRRWPWPRPAAR
jgi:hypothetical protein